MKKVITIVAILIITLPVYSQIDNEVNKRIDEKTKPLADSVKKLRTDFGDMIYDTVIVKTITGKTGAIPLDTLTAPINSRRIYSLKLEGLTISGLRFITVENKSNVYRVVSSPYPVSLNAPSGVSFVATSSTRGVIVTLSGVNSPLTFKYERKTP